jgi:hypothetical protein
LRIDPHSPIAKAMLRSLVLASLTLAGGAAWAQYIWKDAQGQTHVSDMPPPRDTPDKNVIKRPAAKVPAATQATAAAAPGSAASAGAKAPVDPELEARRKRTEQEAAAKSKAEEDRVAAQRADNCQRARQHLATLENGQRLIRFNDKGERVPVDDAARADEAALARRAMASDCR